MDYSPVSIILSILITAVAYLLYPLLLVFGKSKLTEKQIKKSSRRNSIIVFILFLILHIMINDGGTPNMVAAVFWYYIVKWILTKNCLIEPEEPVKEIVLETPIEPVNPNTTNEVVSEKVEVIPEPVVVPEKVEQPKQIAPTPVPTQHKRSTGLIITTIILSVLVVVLVGLNLFQYSKISDCKKQIKELEDRPTEYIVEQNNEEYLDYWSQNHNKLDFYDENIVFVIDGYGDYYYTYDQMETVTQGVEEYEYWAYNKEQAIYLGYKKWK